MDISSRGIELIKSFEGAYTKLPDGRYKSYLDKLAKPNVWTIYTGLTKGVGKDTCWTVEECESHFRKELNIYEDAIERLVTVPLNQNQFDALTSFVYNCGVGALQKSTLLKLLNQGKYEQVPAQLMRWVNAGGVRYAGLVRRRQAEGALFMEPMPVEVPLPERNPIRVEETADEPSMPQRVEAVPVATTVEAIKESASAKTLLGGLPVALYGAVTNTYEWGMAFLKEAGPEIVATKTAMGPFDALVKMTPTLALWLTVGVIGVVLVRKICDRRVGTSV